MRKWVILGVAVVALLAFSTMAWGGYIFEDPIFGIGDREVNVLVGMSVPEGETVSKPTKVYMLVPRNVPARVIDPMDCIARVVHIGPQYGPLRVSLALVKVPRTDQHSRFPIQVTLFDDAGYSLTLPGRSGRFMVVPYVQWQ